MAQGSNHIRKEPKPSFNFCLLELYQFCLASNSLYFIFTSIFKFQYSVQFGWLIYLFSHFRTHKHIHYKSEINCTLKICRHVKAHHCQSILMPIILRCYHNFFKLDLRQVWNIYDTKQFWLWLQLLIDRLCQG